MIRRVQIGEFLPVAILSLAILPAGCAKPSETRTYASSVKELSYRVEEYQGRGAIAPNSTAVFAVLRTAQGHSEKLVLSGTYVDLESISWVGDNEGSICLSGGYTEIYRRIVALSVGSRFTHT